MRKGFTGASAHIDAVVVEDGKVRVTAVAGATRSTRVADLYDGVDVEALVASEVQSAMVLAEMVDAGVDKGTAATECAPDQDEGLREGSALGEGFDEIRGNIARLEERALQVEANLRDANARCRQFEKRAERADWIAAELRRDEFQWQDSIPVDEMNGKRILVQVRGTEGGIKRIKAFIAREELASSNLHESLLAAKARIKALEAEKAERRVAILERAAERLATIEEHYPKPFGLFLKSGTVKFRATQEVYDQIEAALPAEAFWRLASDAPETASDTSGHLTDSGGIDAVVAGVDVQRDTCALDIRAVRSGEHPVLKVAVAGPGSVDLVRQIISDIHLPSVTEPLAVARPMEVNVGKFATTEVDPMADVDAFRRAVRAGF